MDYSKIGKLTRLYPEDEAIIVKTIMNDKDNTDILNGKTIVDKYGYNINGNPWKIKNYKYKLFNFILKNSLIIGLALVILIFFFIFFIKKIY